MQIYKRTSNIFTLVQKVKISYIFSASINKPRLCRGSKSYFISKRSPSKGTIISKIHNFFLHYKTFHRNIIRLHFVCLKMLLTAIIQED